MLRLLRRIVVLGVTQDEAYTNWTDAKKAVQERQNQVNAAIVTLRNAGGAAEADKAQNAVDKVMQAVAKVRSLTTLDEVKKAGGDAIKFMEEAVAAVSDLLSSGGLVYAVGSGWDSRQWDWYVITESGNTQTFPVNKILKILGERVMPVSGLKDYWLSPKGGKVSLLRRRDGTRIPVAKSSFTGDLGDIVYRNNCVYYRASTWVLDSNSYYTNDKGERGFYEHRIYRFRVSASPVAQLLHEGKSSWPYFAVDKDGNMVLAAYGSGKGLQFFEAKSDGTIDTANPIPLTNNGQPITSGSFNFINGPKGEIYVLQKTWQNQLQQNSQTKLQLYTLGAIKQDANSKRVVPLLKKDSVSFSGNASMAGTSVITTKTAVFSLWEVQNNSNTDYQVLRLANDSLSKVGGLPDSPKFGQYDFSAEYGNSAAGSAYIYTRLGNAIYRAGATGGFTKFFDGEKQNLTFIDRGFAATNFGDEIKLAVAAKDNSDQDWIIRLKPDGTEKLPRIEAKGKVAELVYLDF